MCHRSVGLIQNRLEEAGLATVSITTKREISSGVGVPRAAHIRFPLGSPLGEPGKAEQQRSVLQAVLEVLETAQEPGTVVELPFRWRRM